MTNKNRFLWLGGKVMHIEDATVNVLSPTAQFGANVFEGIRCYWNEEMQQLYAFRLPEHYRRLKNSMKMFRMEDKYSIEELESALIEVIKANEYKEDIAVRQTVFIDGFGSWNSTGPVNMFIAPIPKSRMLNSSKTGLKCCISSWERISDKNISPKVKVGANYINSRMAQMEAIENGYDSALLMNNQGKVAEGPGSCLFIIRDGVLITPPITASILESITRFTIIELARNDLNIKVVERDIDRTELYMCDEAFLCGSAMEVTPVLSVDKISIGNELPGSITEAIKEIYLKVVSGEIEAYSKWLTPIY
ncbi:branched-chain amino acid transaminase [Planococcus liqunii]|uniref:Branched-chain-amino-acid aminotransferase n=1 Tax=Planococcus liqunii TaxID=3058394 RepID=A0ABT8MNQ3_9BACL|nr:MULTISPECIES: branched-chain amino acid transaminase [unclassified Planococcus (in: firmicutes)]MDN7226405.1 branched-chain amino acid transaminase [Planococcus sp. N064]WKA50178.1 branched-chain amino acid transaminase [Planococcus sp. N056]